MSKRKARPTNIWRYERVSPTDPLRNETSQTFDKKIGDEWMTEKVEPHMAKDTVITVTVGTITWGEPRISRYVMPNKAVSGDSKGGAQ